MKTIRPNTATQIKAKLYASEIKKHFDTPRFQDLLYRSNDYKDFLYIKLKYPTIADIARREELIKNPIRFPMEYRKNLELVNDNSIVRYMQSCIRSKIDHNHVKTEKIRNILINNDRFSLDYVKPKLDCKWQKLILKLKSLF